MLFYLSFTEIALFFAMIVVERYALENKNKIVLITWVSHIHMPVLNTLNHLISIVDILHLLPNENTPDFLIK